MFATRKILAFISGLKEFRLCFTAHYSEHELSKCYELGRELAHLLTFRHFEQS
jgi:hypothetical protein